MTEPQNAPFDEELGPLWRSVQGVHTAAMRDDISPAEYRIAMLAALDDRDPEITAASPLEATRNPQAPADLYAAIGMEMFRADCAGAEASVAIALVGNVAFELLSERIAEQSRVAAIRECATLAKDASERMDGRSGPASWGAREVHDQILGLLDPKNRKEKP